MTFVWFVTWLIANTVGGHEPLEADPVNAWAATLILAMRSISRRPRDAPVRSPPSGRGRQRMCALDRGRLRP